VNFVIIFFTRERRALKVALQLLLILAQEPTVRIEIDKFYRGDAVAIDYSSQFGYYLLANWPSG
jgi:hypothetical protein